ncbi:MAG: J domain-containing protein [Synechococcus sp. SB0673_bin_10]|nr:J domain-containing protein [Cyanobacteria bacterium MAG IRC1_bin_28]MXX08809.1 J domain-containing protein [Synechococcus sp. SB0667_bin_8]MYF36322.1 J domain-containing protein [Synechococcus sp. SB0678_bin_12]MYG63415.1 J domain-containing protein [Synechococcus sp. SB0675_bin_7]MYI72288.1 J domain-containing protein [Synechococcus sp. SB0673_bin_10]MYK84819.1 J domain-containing protein [Synechococcus sp. SB0669_bin_7]
MRLLDYYRELQVPRHADRAMLRQAFLRLCKQHHPDTTTLPAAVASERFRRIRTAYATLQDPAARQRHDAWLRQHSPMTVAPVGIQTVQEHPVSPERPLSGGEWLALIMLACTLLFCAGLAGILVLQQS